MPASDMSKSWKGASLRRCALLLFGTIMAMPVMAEENNPLAKRPSIFPGPYRAQIVRIVDGDTIGVSVDLWPGLSGEYDVRLRGIDAPESRSSCEEERELAEQSTDAVTDLYPQGRTIRLRDVEYGAFAGRVVATVEHWTGGEWASVADALVADGLAERWSPDDPDIPWCLLASERLADR